MIKSGEAGRQTTCFHRVDWAVAASEKFIQKYKNHSLITPAVAPHAIYTTPDAALIAAHDLAQKYYISLLIHRCGNEEGVDDARQQRGMTPTENLQKLGILTGRVVLHMAFGRATVIFRF